MGNSAKKKLEDVAKLADVSKTTVSRVINRRGYLSQKTIKKVEQAITALNYHPNIIARQLYKNKTELIGILIPTVANPFFGELTYYLEKYLFSMGFKVLIGNAMNDPQKEEEYLQHLLGHQVDGLIVGTHNRGIKEYENINLPIVAIEREIGSDIPIVDSDNYNGGVLATTALIKHGARNIIHTDGPKDLETPDQNRRIAYEKVMKKHNLVPITYTLDFNISIEQKRKIFTRIFTEHPEVDGIFAGNDTDAALIMDIAEELGYKIPVDLKLVGYDGTEITQELMPQLATVIQPIKEMAEKAASLLIDRINGEETANEYKFPVDFKYGSTL